MWIFAPEKAAASEIDNKALQPTTVCVMQGTLFSDHTGVVKNVFSIQRGPPDKMLSKHNATCFGDIDTC